MLNLIHEEQRYSNKIVSDFLFLPQTEVGKGMGGKINPPKAKTV